MGVCWSLRGARHYREEKHINGTKPIPRWVSQKIDTQLEQNICKVYVNQNIIGTGFLCKIPYPDEFKLLPVLITNNHVLNQEFYSNNKEFKITFNEDKIIKLINIIPERNFYTSEKYDVTIIEILPNEDNIHQFLEFNEDKAIEKEENSLNLNIYVLQYPNADTSSTSYGFINKINEFEIEHKCSTETGSSGGPIILLNTFKVIGVHKGSSKNKEQINYGTLLRYPILEFNSINNEIIIKIKIEENDINKDIYILNNPNHTNEDGIKNKYNGLKELTKTNTLMFINNEKVEYKKYKKFHKKGIYEIKITLKNNLVNAFCMFLGCKNIIDIDLSKFETRYINNMCAMFDGCHNLTNINLSSFVTKNVKNMSSMFYGCKNLTNLDLSSFDTQNVTNMGSMFVGCNNLVDIDLSSFDTSNVVDMNGIFYGCSSLTNINLNSFDTKKVTDMGCMFHGCNSLINLDLSSFDTNKVTNLNGIFYECNNLKNINLSSFNTQNVNNMGCMFYNCNNLTSINLSSFNTNNTTDIGCMFYGCNNLTSIDLSSFNTKKVTNMN